MTVKDSVDYGTDNSNLQIDESEGTLTYRPRYNNMNIIMNISKDSIRLWSGSDREFRSGFREQIVPRLNQDLSGIEI